jgi:copper chaperone
MTTLTIAIDGMTCGHCLRTVDGALRSLPGVSVEHLKVGSATVTFDETVIDQERIAQAIEDAGYGVLQMR